MSTVFALTCQECKTEKRVSSNILPKTLKHFKLIAEKVDWKIALHEESQNCYIFCSLDCISKFNERESEKTDLIGDE